MAYTNASQFGTQGDTQGNATSGVLGAISEFVRAWIDTSAAHTAYRELSGLSNAKLAARGLRREDVARTAMDLPALRRE